MTDIIKLYDDYKDTFDLYSRELLAYNEHINLTAIRDPKEVEQKHFIDSLSILSFVPEGTKTLVDVGTGAGFPGIPIAIVRPDIHVTLIESIGKKAKFLEYIIDVLKLTNVEVVCARAEDVSKHIDYKNHFDVGVARAVAKLDILSGFILPLIKKGGLFLAQKGTKEDIEESREDVLKYGGNIEKIVPIEIPNLEARQIVIIKKINAIVN